MRAAALSVALLALPSGAWSAGMSLLGEWTIVESMPDEEAE